MSEAENIHGQIQLKIKAYGKLDKRIPGVGALGGNMLSNNARQQFKYIFESTLLHLIAG